MHTRLFTIAAVSLSLGLNAQNWNEVGDAGDLATTSAQCTIGTGALTTITGDATGGVSGANETDAYLIRIADMTTFSASTCGATGPTSWDTRLYLFHLDGTGIQMSDDGCSTCCESSMDNSFASNGTFVLVVGSFNNDAHNINGDDIWLDSPFGVTRAPDGPGAGMPVLDHWSNESGTTQGTYVVTLTGCEYASAGASHTIVAASAGNGCFGSLTSNNVGPVAGGDWDLQVGGGFGGGLLTSDIVTVVFKLGGALPVAGLPPPSYTCSETHVGLGPFVILPIQTGGTSYNFLLNLVDDPNLYGLPMSCQAVGLDTGPGLFFTCENCLVGTYGCL